MSMNRGEVHRSVGYTVHGPVRPRHHRTDHPTGPWTRPQVPVMVNSFGRTSPKTERLLSTVELPPFLIGSYWFRVLRRGETNRPPKNGSRRCKVTPGSLDGVTPESGLLHCLLSSPHPSSEKSKTKSLCLKRHTQWLALRRDQKQRDGRGMLGPFVIVRRTSGDKVRRRELDSSLGKVTVPESVKIPYKGR